MTVVPRSHRSKSSAVAPQGADKSFFLNIKGLELLNKYVGETERHIRLVLGLRQQPNGQWR